MKSKHITIGLTVLSLVAIILIAPAAAQIILYPVMTVDKKARNITLTILTDTAGFLAADVDPESIIVHMWDMRNNPLTDFDPDDAQIDLAGSIIVIHLVMNVRAGIPPTLTLVTVTGDIVSGTHSGDTFLASGPGWGWGAHF